MTEHTTLTGAALNRAIASYQMGIVAGAATRGGIIRAIKQACWSVGLEPEIKEDYSFLSSLYLITIEGDVNAVAAVRRWFETEMVAKSK